MNAASLDTETSDGVFASVNHKQLTIAASVSTSNALVHVQLSIRRMRPGVWVMKHYWGLYNNDVRAWNTLLSGQALEFTNLCQQFITH